MDSNPIRIDGSIGEGGGQILRTALMLSVITGRAVEIDSIRSKRPNPGLRPQHLAALNAFVSITSGKLSGGTVGSTAVRFAPGDSTSRDVSIDVGTAGSITLILSSLIPALSSRGAEMTVRIRGGTDTKWSPTFDYLLEVAGPLYKAFGIDFSLELRRRGYYPVGGGEVVADIRPCSKIRPIRCVERGEMSISIKSVSSNLPKHVAERQAEAARSQLEKNGISVKKWLTFDEPALSPGSSICIYGEGPSPPAFIGGDAVGDRGIRAEDVGIRAAQSFLSCYESGAALDVHCADMAVPLMCLAEGESEIGFPEMTGHVESNIYVTSLFIGNRIVREKSKGIEMLRTTK